MANLETVIQGRIMEALSVAGCLVWRNNTGALPDGRTGRLVKYGLCKGSSDIIGIAPGGRFLAVEVKTPTGRATKEQELFLAAVRRRGGIGFVARSADEAVALLRAALDQLALDLPHTP